VDSLGDFEFDIFHVDGDHTPAGCFHDMELAAKVLRPGGWMIVDDFKFDIIKEGVRRWREKYPEKIRAAHNMENVSFRGDIILQMK
jgi:hypothetical protein